jgi:hypothetical protein
MRPGIPETDSNAASWHQGRALTRLPLRPHWLAIQLKCQPTFEDVGRQVRSALATERTLRDDPARRHCLYWGRDVLTASLATDHVVANAGWRQVEHEARIGE